MMDDFTRKKLDEINKIRNKIDICLKTSDELLTQINDLTQKIIDYPDNNQVVIERSILLKQRTEVLKQAFELSTMEMEKISNL